MFLLNHVHPEEADGKVAEAYAVFPSQMPVPEPLQLMSASPELARLQSHIIRYYMSQKNLDAGLLSIIRYLVANEIGYPFCIAFNSKLLQMAGGFSEADLENLRSHPEQLPLEEEQKALVLFVLKVVKSPEAVTRADVDRLRELGWSDESIFDAAYHGASMAGPATLYKAFAQKE